MGRVTQPLDLVGLWRKWESSLPNTNRRKSLFVKHWIFIIFIQNQEKDEYIYIYIYEYGGFLKRVTLKTMGFFNLPMVQFGTI